MSVAAAAAHGGAMFSSSQWNPLLSSPPPPPSSIPSVGVTLPETDPNFDAEAELIFLNKLERKAFTLQQKGHHLYAIELMEQSVASRKLLYGPLSEEVMVASEKLALLYNSLAMSSLYKEEYKQSLRLLRKAELLTSHISALASVRVQTLNNLACAYRRLQRPKTALNLLRESLVLLTAEQTIEGRHVTHLNMCAILSQLHRHEEAIEHAKAAVMWCQKQLLASSPASSDAAATKDPTIAANEKERRRAERRRERQRRMYGDESDATSHGSYSSDGDDADHKSSDANLDSAATAASRHQELTEKIVILGIAYHNLGVEEEFLKHYDACLEWYSKALKLAQQHIGESEEITKTFKESYSQAKKVRTRGEEYMPIE